MLRASPSTLFSPVHESTEEKNVNAVANILQERVISAVVIVAKLAVTFLPIG